MSGAWRALAALVVAAALGASAAEPKDRVSVKYQDPDRFVDVGMSPADPPRVRAGLLEELRRYIERDAAELIPAGTQLEITITQLDMAGAFRPAPGGGTQVRTIGDSTPPRIDLRFVLRGADGAVLREGTRELRNPQFLFASPPSSAPLRHERVLVEDWLAREFTPPR